ncbi:hypothetical protein ACXGQW_07835 [Wenyingzhuangia sp. IMCC45533]
MRNLLLMLTMLSFMVSCSKKDVNNLSIKGTIKDKFTNERVVLKESELKVECWKWDGSRDDSYADFERIKLPTDSSGEFSLDFDKGALIIVIIKAEGYQKYVKKIYAKKSDNTCDISLIPL